MLPKAAGRGQHFQFQGLSFSLNGPTLNNLHIILSLPKNSRKLYWWQRWENTYCTKNRSLCRIRYRSFLQKKIKCNIQFCHGQTRPYSYSDSLDYLQYGILFRLLKMLQTFPLCNIFQGQPRCFIIYNLSNCSFIAETAALDEIDLVFAISSTAAGAEVTFQRIKDTVKEIMETYKTDKLRYALLAFGRQPITPIQFDLSLPDDETVSWLILLKDLIFCLSALHNETKSEVMKYGCVGQPVPRYVL